MGSKPLGSLSVIDTSILERKGNDNPSFHNRIRSYHLPVTGPDSLPVSCIRLVGANDSKFAFITAIFSDSFTGNNDPIKSAVTELKSNS